MSKFKKLSQMQKEALIVLLFLGVCCTINSYKKQNGYMQLFIDQGLIEAPKTKN